MKKIYKRLLCMFLVITTITTCVITEIQFKSLETVFATDERVDKDLPFEIVSTTYGIYDERVTAKEINITGDNTEILFVMNQDLIFLKEELTDNTSNIYILGHTGLITQLNVDSEDSNWENSALSNGYGYGSLPALKELCTDIDYRKNQIYEGNDDTEINSVHNIYYMYNNSTNTYTIVDATDGDYIVCDEIDNNCAMANKAVVITIDGKEGIYSLETGKLIYECQYDEINIENDKIAIGKEDDKLALLMLNRSDYIQPEYDWIDFGNNIYVCGTKNEERVDIIGRNGKVLKSFYKDDEYSFCGHTIVDDKVYVNCNYDVETKAIRKSDSKEFTRMVEATKCYAVSNNKCIDMNELFGVEYMSVNTSNSRALTDTIEVIKYNLELVNGYLASDGSDVYTGWAEEFEYYKLNTNGRFIINNHYQKLFNIPQEDIKNDGREYIDYYFIEDGSYAKFNESTNLYEYYNKYGIKVCNLGESEVSALKTIGDKHIFYDGSIIDTSTGEVVLEDINYAYVNGVCKGYYNDEFVDSGYIFVFKEETNEVGILNLSNNYWTGYIWDGYSGSNYIFYGNSSMKIYKLGNDKYMFKLGHLYLDEDFNTVIERSGEVFINNNNVSFYDVEETADNYRRFTITIYDSNFNQTKKYYCNDDIFNGQMVSSIDKNYRWFYVLSDYIPMLVYDTEVFSSGSKLSQYGYCDKNGNKKQIYDKYGSFSNTDLGIMVNGLAYIELDYDGYIVDKFGNKLVNLGGSYNYSYYLMNLRDIRTAPVLDTGYYITIYSGNLCIYDLTQIIQQSSEAESEDGIIVKYKIPDTNETLTLNTQILTDQDEEYNEINFDEKIADEDVSAGDIDFTAYKIELCDENNEVLENEEVTIKIPCPDEYYGDKCNVYRVNEDGTFTYVESKCEDGYMKFDNNSSGIYILTETNLISTPDIVYGDVNGDGEIDIKDSALIKRYLAGWDVELDLEATDVNGDGEATIKDSALIKRYLAGWDVEFTE